MPRELHTSFASTSRSLPASSLSRRSSGFGFHSQRALRIAAIFFFFVPGRTRSPPSRRRRRFVLDRKEEGWWCGGFEQEHGGRDYCATAAAVFSRRQRRPDSKEGKEGDGAGRVVIHGVLAAPVVRTMTSNAGSFVGGWVCLFRKPDGSRGAPLTAPICDRLRDQRIVLSFVFCLCCKP